MSALQNYDPNGPGVKNGRFMGLPFTEEEATCILYPVPWDVTTSYGAGTAGAPDNILDASYQLDLFDPQFPESWKKGLFLMPSDPIISERNEQYRQEAKKVIDLSEDPDTPEPPHDRIRRINDASRDLNTYVYHATKTLLDKNKKILLLGGDHSTPFGYIKALAEKHGDFGILQIDAHCDFRRAYQGFEFSHASIMHQVITKIPEVKKLIQAGIRDLCPEENEFLRLHSGRIHTHMMHDLRHQLFTGVSWSEQTRKIIGDLPEKVYLSFDIDGLDPSLCPHTGTPVPGGLEYHEAIYLIEEILRSGRVLIGADLCEVAGNPHEWDGNVGARVAYKIALLLLES